ncbi:hypothetical protein PNK_p0043 (plasmid) [Candidatus Protochlamydia naegleriophila]|uniref:Uncharacterized protein n=1 Tax=Candidatus Protochlamydia naegleriophila TaxID=389348 RepID=A0A0U5EV89_9BACT|nr:hypothetical protein [Candidatus Protochlamydia naegleriophila]CUI18097.1 hypothetical protein PNK_p0043 [Candidatus Protochlamydia naegleriophila]
MEKLVDKLVKYKDKLDSDKVIDIMLDIKHEIESYTGKNIDLKKGLEKNVWMPSELLYGTMSNCLLKQFF